MDQSSERDSPRRSWPAIAAAVGLALSIPPPAPAEARDDQSRRSELLVPQGWEASARDHERAVDDELLTPDGWNTRSGARWSDPVCSEVIVPAAWSAHTRTL